MYEKKRICFVNGDNYPVLNSEYGANYIGGESVQQVLIARFMAENGYDVSTAVLDYGQQDGECIDGVTVWKTFRTGSGLPVFRFIHPKLTSILRALRRADADVYYQSCASMVTGVVAWYCRRHGKKMIFRVAHDTDCIPGKQLIPNVRDRKIYEYGLRRADFISAQSVYQQELLKKNYGLDSTIINMAVEPPAGSTVDRDIDILWVNNFRGFKCPERFVELASRMSGFRFVMIGGPVPGHERLFEEVQSAARLVNNLEVTGFVPYAEISSYYSRSKLFVNTSDSEGFPNSFLQSWIRGTPVVSFFDPDNIIGSNRLGAVPGSMDDMVELLGRMLAHTDELSDASQRVRKFAEENYLPSAVASRYASMVDELVSS